MTGCPSRAHAARRQRLAEPDWLGFLSGLPARHGPLITGAFHSPRPTSPGPQPFPEAPPGSEGPGFEFPALPAYRDLTEEERELLALQLERSRKAAAMQDQIIASLERLYGRPFADEFAAQAFRTEQHQREQLELAAEALGLSRREMRRGEERSEALRSEYIARLGRTPEAEAARQAGREALAAEELFQDFETSLPRRREVASRMFDRWRKAERGESDFDPTLTRAIGESRQELDETMRRQLGPGWEQSTGGSRRKADLDQSVAETLYRARKQEMAEAMNPGLYAGEVVGPSPSTARLLVSQSGVHPAALNAPSPITTSAPILSYATGPVPGALPLSSMMADERGRANQYGLNLYGTRYAGALQGALGRFRANQDLLRDYYNNLFRGRLAEFQESGDFYGSLIGAAGSVAAAY
jgi:hypothetical protein